MSSGLIDRWQIWWDWRYYLYLIWWFFAISLFWSSSQSTIIINLQSHFPSHHLTINHLIYHLTWRAKTSWEMINWEIWINDSKSYFIWDRERWRWWWLWFYDERKRYCHLSHNLPSHLTSLVGFGWSLCQDRIKEKSSPPFS